MGAPSVILRSLSLRRMIQPRAPPSMVAPLPEKSRFDERLTAELDTLRPPQQGSAGLIRFLDASIAAQKIALGMLVNIPYRDDTDRGALEHYLETNVEILDSCNHLSDKIEIVKKYLDSLRVVLRFVDGSFSSRMRAMEHLESIRGIERKCKSVSKRNGLRRILRQKLGHYESELGEIMSGSKAMALMACEFLELGLSFDSKRRIPTITESQRSRSSSSWLRMLLELVNQEEGSEKTQRRRCVSHLIMEDLRETVRSVRDLEEVMKGKREREVKSAVEGLKRKCRGLEDEIEIVEERVKDLYRSLIDVRMAVLGILSQA
ncbi:uncharacterized protein LOC129292124 [Prosopis cineraria]|uniref:uncharacterized protein LOC129292124 n=1 Tax=Prosopis cineraria TaxID=364024 RepID=UPI0024103532|nr:uncharacterized protein LOC129292124 [Prosopis cineraria]